MKPSGPKIVDPFQVPWATTARRYPPTGASHRTARLRDATAMPTPIPVKEVNRGWANGLAKQRTTKVVVSAEVPPGPMPSVPL